MIKYPLKMEQLDLDQSSRTWILQRWLSDPIGIPIGNPNHSESVRHS